MTDDIRTKKLMNAPEDIIPEAIEGMLSAHPDLLRVEGAMRRALIAWFYGSYSAFSVF